MKYLLSCAAVILFCITATGFPDSRPDTKPVTVESVREFGIHLFQKQDYLRSAMELEKYLYLSQSRDDTILYTIGLAHQMRNRYGFAARSFAEILELDKSALKQKARLAYLYNLSLNRDWKIIREIPDLSDSLFFFRYLADVQSGEDPGKGYFDDVNDPRLKQQYLELEAYRDALKKRSPVVASLLSAVIPGAGKLYIKRSWDGLYTLGMTTFFACVSYNAFRNDRNITGLITGGMSLSFYLGTIYGSWIGAEQFNDHLYDTWLLRLQKLDPVIDNPYWKQWIDI